VAAKPKKLVLTVIDALKPEMLERAVEQGRAPVLEEIMKRGTYVPECVSTFPSVTPVAAAAIATGLTPKDHHIPAMNWFHRGEERYVEYGSSFEASRQFGLLRSLVDTVYNMNLSHLSREVKTVFEHLQDEDIRTVGTTYLMFRGRTRHEASDDGMYPRLARVANFRHAAWGPDELFYADLFASRKTGCRGALGMPGQRDQHTACVGAHCVENDLFDFMLFSLPDNDTYSHKRGPYAQVTSIASADRALEQLMHAGGGPDEFLEEHAVIVMSDHSQIAVVDRVNLGAALAGFDVLTPYDSRMEGKEIAVCPSQRSAQVYVLDDDRRDSLTKDAARDLEGVEGVDLVVRQVDDGEAAVWSPRGELRFGPGGDLIDPRGCSWSVDGDLDTLGLDVGDGRVSSGSYPDALGRLWSALESPTTGDVLLSAGGGYEFVDWGGVAHVGGGSHGSLHRGDSLGALITAGVEMPERESWGIQDVTPMILDHFGIGADAAKPESLGR
jgi:predicted AlkP superfamily pyrophosphatase or phosphodiesterase